MKLSTIMAQLISLSTLFTFIFINYQLWRSVNSQIYTHLSDAFLQQEVTYDELYQSGMQSYTNEDWSGTIFFFERALQEFDYFRNSLTECRLKCQNISHISSSGNDALSEMRLFEAVFKKAECTRRCKLKKLGKRSDRIDDAVTDKFLSMTPYSYLQFAYYKSGLYERAVAAAFTYLQWHPEDDVMQNNLDYYRNMHGIDESQLTNFEERAHHKNFLVAYQAHQDQDWSIVISSMESALTEYWKANAQCRALCEGKYDNREFMDLYEAIANHYASTLYCKDQCESWLARINGKQVEDYLPSHFHFLQFAYYKADDLQNAITNAVTYLLFHPDDEVMTQNLAFYQNMDNLMLNFDPRPDAEAYHNLVAMERKMLNFAKRHFWNEDADEFLYPDKEEDEDDSNLDYLGAEPIDPKEVNLKQNEAVNIRGDYGILSDYDDNENIEKESGHPSEGKDAGDGIVNHEAEKRSAKYSKDLNHAGLQRPGPGPGPGEASEVRNKILSGMKKIMQSLTGVGEEESEKMLVELAKDPKTGDVKDKLKIAIEKMMASGELEKAFPRDQLKAMIQGLSINSDGVLSEDGGGEMENFDPEAVGKLAKDVPFPSNHEKTMLDLDDYDPMKGLDQKEYFDWVNPPGYEAGAPGGPVDDAQEEEEEDVDRHGDWDEEEDVGVKEFHPSDEESSSLDKQVDEDVEGDVPEHDEDIKALPTMEDDHDVDDACLSKPDCNTKDKDHHKYLNEQDESTTLDRTKTDLSDMQNEDRQDEGSIGLEDGQRNGEKIVGETEDRTRGVEYLESEVGQRKGDDLDEEELGMSEVDECGLCDEDEEEEEEMEIELTPDEAKAQRIVDGEGMTDDTRHWMAEMMQIDDNAYFLLDDLLDLDVVMTDGDLNGTNRVVVDRIAADQECGVLLQLLDGEAKIGNGYKGKPNPHTKYEQFEGLTVRDAVDAASKGRIPLLYPTVYMHLAERSRQFVQKHFQLKTHLFFSFTHLVCREAEPGIMLAYSTVRRQDLSHPVHADNCQLDRYGKCHKKLPAFVWRDWSAILYLNQDFEGGEFIFANANQSAQAVVTPKCGRLVGFSAGSENLHGVKGVVQGRRCALAMWFTLDPRFREMEFFQAADQLNTLYEQEYTQEGL